ncbi:zinc-binding dehydrogenase [Bradyrhizobium sp. STM 3562]|uniref:zinc-binding dehydrogenase n=1 Tax=Bradyrhizobium sp. STM 3562 TaxID=578924 RepID=UPI00388D8552
MRDIRAPEAPPPGHILVDMDAATITHGDKFFLTRPLPGATRFVPDGHDVYGANGSGKVAAVGAGVPSEYLGKQVAIYKSISRSPDTIGLWCERAQVSYRSCLILPDDVRARDYCGSFANILTVYAFLSEIQAKGHKGIIVTAGNSATGYIAASLTRRRNVPAIFLVRSASAREELIQHGVENVLLTRQDDFEAELGKLTTQLGTTAVFDGVGGALVSRILPILPMNSTIYIYGFLGGSVPITLPTMLLMEKNLTLRRFSNLESATVSDPQRLAAAMKEIEGLVDDPLFKTRIGKEFSFHQIDEAMAYEPVPGVRALLVPRSA